MRADRCKQILGNRQCRMEVSDGGYCHKHKDQTLYARVARRCRTSPGLVEEVAATLIDEMGWPEINAYNAERRTGQSVREDAGGYVLRCLGRLFGVEPRNEVVTYKAAMTAMLRQAEKDEAAV